jgi:HAD superfamily hydrolase (TIGR01493 family)
MKPVECLVFDAYGTVFDVHSIVTALDRRFPGQGLNVSKAWRARQLEYTWLRSLMNTYEDFWKVTRVRARRDLQFHEAAPRSQHAFAINGGVLEPQTFSGS